MELKTRHIIAREKKQITFLLYGLIGDKVDGDYFAQELMYADKEFDEIIIRINSDGGSVSQGLSIVSAMMAAKAFIIAQVDGVAASMAAALLPAADHVRMNDYARIMLHSPYYVDDDGNRITNLSAKEKKALDALKGIIITLLSKRGKEEEYIKKLLITDTWYNAQEALDEGLIDEIIATGKKELAAMAPKQLVAMVDSEYEPFKQQRTMKKILAKLGLPENSTEETVIETLEKREREIVDRYIRLGEDVGVINDDNRESMRKLAMQDVDLYLKVVDQLKAAKPVDTKKEKLQARLSQLVDDRAKKIKAEKTYDWYQRNDPQALAKIKEEDPEKFNQLLDEYEASL